MVLAVQAPQVDPRHPGRLSRRRRAAELPHHLSDELVRHHRERRSRSRIAQRRGAAVAAVPCAAVPAKAVTGKAVSSGVVFSGTIAGEAGAEPTGTVRPDSPGLVALQCQQPAPRAHPAGPPACGGPERSQPGVITVQDGRHEGDAGPRTQPVERAGLIDVGPVRRVHDNARPGHEIRQPVLIGRIRRAADDPLARVVLPGAPLAVGQDDQVGGVRTSERDTKRA